MPWRAWSSFFSPFRGIAWPRDSILSRISAGALFLPVAFAAAQSSSSRNHSDILGAWEGESKCTVPDSPCHDEHVIYEIAADKTVPSGLKIDRKSTRLNSSHGYISYAVFCLKKKTIHINSK